MTRVYYKFAIAAVIGSWIIITTFVRGVDVNHLKIIVFDLQRPATFDAVLKVCFNELNIYGFF